MEEEQEIIGLIDFERDKKGRIVEIKGKSHSLTKINYSSLAWTARLSESLEGFSSSSNRFTIALIVLTIALIVIGIIQIIILFLSAFDIL